MCRGGTGTRQSRAGQNRAEPDRTGQKWAETNRNGQEWDRPGKAWRDATGQKRNRARWGWAGCEWVTEERTGPCRLGWGGACTAGRAPRSPRAMGGSKKPGLAAVSLSARCVFPERGAAAALSRPRDLELAAKECRCPGLPWPARAGSFGAGEKAHSGGGSIASSGMMTAQVWAQSMSLRKGNKLLHS